MLTIIHNKHTRPIIQDTSPQKEQNISRQFRWWALNRACQALSARRRIWRELQASHGRWDSAGLYKSCTGELQRGLEDYYQERYYAELKGLV